MLIKIKGEYTEKQQVDPDKADLVMLDSQP